MRRRGVFGIPFAIGMIACSMAGASPTELTARPTTTDIVDWGQLGTPNLTFTTPQYFTSSSGDILGTVYFNGPGSPDAPPSSFSRNNVASGSQGPLMAALRAATR
jgi:hypothetical protein